MPNYWPIGGGGGGGGQPQTPWTQNVNASGFQLQNCPEVINNATTGGATGITLQTTGQIDANSSGAFVVQTGQGMGVGVDPTGTPYFFDVAGVSNITSTTTGFPNTSGTTLTGQVLRLATTSTSVLDIGNDATSGGSWLQATDRTGFNFHYILTLNPNGGNVGVGATMLAPKFPLHVAGPGSAPQLGVGVDSNGAYGVQFTYSNPNGAIQALANNAGSILSLNAAGGNVGIGTLGPTHQLELSIDSAAKPTTNTWTISSDIRTKRNVQSFKGDIEVIRKLEPIVAEYNGLAGTPKGQRVVSFDAAELRKLVPPCVSSVRAKLREGDEEETDVLGVNTHELFFHLIRAVQDIDRRLQAAERGNGSKRK